MSEDETPASLLLRDAKVNLRISDVLAAQLPEAPFQHEVYFQAFYAIEKAIKAVCSICGVALKNNDWNPQLKTHKISELLKMIEGNPKLDNQIASKLTLLIGEIPFDPAQKYPNLEFRTIPHESFTTNTANTARTYAHQFVSDIENWIASLS